MKNSVTLIDFTNLTKNDLTLNWLNEEENINEEINQILLKSNRVNISKENISIRDTLPKINKNGVFVRQPRLNLYRNKSKHEKENVNENGFALKDYSHNKLIAPHGYKDGIYVGFMEDNALIRIKEDTCNRITNDPSKVWLKLDHMFVNINITRIQSGPPDQFGYCAYDIESSKTTFTWFAITKSLNGNYPLWANQFDLWAPEITEKEADYWYALCFAFGLAENRCVVSKFEADNPVAGAPEVFVDNPMSPNNEECFYRTTLSQPIEKGGGVALDLKKAIDAFYQYWNKEYTKGQILEHVGLKDEAYFRYFDYPDFVTKDSGLVQIKKYADINGCSDLLSKIQEIQSLTKKVKEEIYRLLVVEFKYFG